MSKKKLSILGLSYSQTQTGAYALVLVEESGKRRIPIIIGGAEAQAIAIEIEGLKPLRPLTHDLFYSLASSFDIEMIEVNIHKLEEGIFYSELIAERDGVRQIIDARTSDAIALAIRFKCPIYTTEKILDSAGIQFESEDDEPTTKKRKTKKEVDILAEKSQDDLQDMLDNAIATENYELASKIRDELKRRK